MKIGIGFDGFMAAPEVLTLAREAEAAGADSLWFLQHMGYREAITMAAATAAVTKTISIVPAAVSPYLWQPTATAMSVATIAELAPGRTEFCISVGNLKNLEESGAAADKPVVVLREYLKAFRELWSGSAVELDGHIHSLKGARLSFETQGPLPIYIASTGPKVMEMAGRNADGVLLSGGLTIGSCRTHIGWARQGASMVEPAGAPHVAALIYLAVGADGEAARRIMKKKLAFLFRSPRQAENIRSSGLPIDHEAIIEAVMRRDLDGAADLLPEEAVDAFAVAGTAEHCKKRLAEYLDIGIDEAVLELSGDASDRSRALELIRELRPR